MAKRVEGLANAGVRVLGGCCGTTSDHIKVMSKAFKAVKPASRGERPFTALASRGDLRSLAGLWRRSLSARG